MKKEKTINKKLDIEHVLTIYGANKPEKVLPDEEIIWAIDKFKEVNTDMTEYLKTSIHFLRNNLTKEKNLRLVSYMLKNILDKYFANIMARVLYLQLELAAEYQEEKLNRARILWEYYWATEGFPVLQLSEQQIASFSISDPLEIEMFKDMRVPWNAFSIPCQNSTIPGLRRIIILELRSIIDKYLEKFPEVEYILPSFNASCFVELTNGLRIWNQEENLYELLKLITSTPDQEDVLKNTTAEQHRTLDLSKTLLLNTITALNQEKLRNPNTQKKKTKKEKKLKHKLKNKKTPDAKEYRLSTPVTIDHTKHVRDYILGKTNKKYTARWLVRGHWRNQPFGPKREKRYRKFIEPYWKGDERNSILIRDYKMKDKEK